MADPEIVTLEEQKKISKPLVSIKPRAEFWAECEITEVGADENSVVRVLYKTQTDSQLQDWFKDLISMKRTRAEIILGLVADIEGFEKPFSAELVPVLLQERSTFFDDITQGYARALQKARTKNS